MRRRHRLPGVHPRACGGNHHRQQEPVGEVGASPRLRGKREDVHPNRPYPGCIPAPAGETTGWHRSRRPPAGASPRLRGKPGRGLAPRLDDRCIPAPAGETTAARRSACAFRVHPRACGGNAAGFRSALRREGASPRLRGKRRGKEKPDDDPRCIPAPAGETRVAVRSGRLPRVHPRACGGNMCAECDRSSGEGASPRLRGKPPHPGAHPLLPGCIPAPAGETSSVAAPPSRSSVHPRACGGNSGEPLVAKSLYGASPRLRGKHRLTPQVPDDAGCIPAPAGETPRRGRRHPPSAVHPRACGGNLVAPSRRRSFAGASPRLRGKRRGRPRASSSPRCIPAPAGETADGSQRRTTRAVHPRACGGNSKSRAQIAPGVGASPRLRGKLSAKMVAAPDVGCIPAPAGETPVRALYAALSRVHPRACGGNGSGSAHPSGFHGASPRLRGKPARILRRRIHRRCIPAPAGETNQAFRRALFPWVHPRACGGNLNEAGVKAEIKGASPRLRGKLRRPVRAALRPGCIPAPAGETTASSAGLTRLTVHPRACGGNHTPGHRGGV